MKLSQAKTNMRHPITSIIEQHVEEAAFCWLRREDSLWRPNVNLNQFQRIEQRLDAHLEGLRLAADYAWPYALKRMNQWKTADEVFAASYISIQTGREEQLNAIAKIVQFNTDSSTGLSAALRWTLLLGDKEKAIAAIKYFWQLSDSIKSALIYTALQIPEINIDLLLTTAIKSTNSTLRTTALKTIGQFQRKDYLSFLLDALKDEDPLCQITASASLAILGKPEYQRDALKLLPLLNRNDRLRHLLIWASTSSEFDFENGLQIIDTNTAVTDYIWANAFRGDSNSIARLVTLLHHKYAAPLAAYAIHHITGADLDSFVESDEPQIDINSLDEEERTLPLHAKKLLRETEGLSKVSPVAVKQWLTNQQPFYAENKRFLNGISIKNPSLTLNNSFSMPQHWHLALLGTLTRETAEWSRFPKPFFDYNKKDFHYEPR